MIFHLYRIQVLRHHLNRLSMKLEKMRHYGLLLAID